MKEAVPPHYQFCSTQSKFSVALLWRCFHRRRGCHSCWSCRGGNGSSRITATIQIQSSMCLLLSFGGGWSSMMIIIRLFFSHFLTFCLFQWLLLRLMLAESKQSSKHWLLENTHKRESPLARVFSPNRLPIDWSLSLGDCERVCLSAACLPVSVCVST